MLIDFGRIPVQPEPHFKNSQSDGSKSIDAIFSIMIYIPSMEIPVTINVSRNMTVRDVILILQQDTRNNNTGISITVNGSEGSNQNEELKYFLMIPSKEMILYDDKTVGYYNLHRVKWNRLFHAVRMFEACLTLQELFGTY